MADSAASTQSRNTRAGSTKKRAAVSTETENKLARAARSAQRLAQLSDASRDDSTLDLFPDDPTRATVEAMNIDLRQGTLRGFELPEVVLAAVGAAEPGGAQPAVSADAKVRRASKAVKADDAGVVSEALPLNGFDVDQPDDSATREAIAADGTLTVVVVAAPAEGFASGAGAGGEASADVSAEADADASAGHAASDAPIDAVAHAPSPSPSPTATPAIAAASVARSVTVLRRPKAAVDRADSASLPGFDTADTEHADAEHAEHPERDSSAHSEAAHAHAAPDAPRATVPELDRARATAFADTVDALYGVIADQRHAAGDHTRRMKWMLSIVVGALLVTVAIGVTQTLLLMRLTRETTAQQHRIEQMMQNQQAAMASLIDAHLSRADAASAADAASSPTTAAAGSTPARHVSRHHRNRNAGSH